MGNVRGVFGGAGENPGNRIVKHGVGQGLKRAGVVNEQSERWSGMII